MAETKCPHKILKRRLSGATNQAWYYCADCDSKLLPHKREEPIPVWDGRVKVLSE